MSRTDLGMPSFPASAARAVNDAQLRRTIRNATQTIRTKRAAAVAELDDWAELRTTAAGIKDRTLRHLDGYLAQAEQAIHAAGGQVHWARDADEANRIVTELVHATGERDVVKVKSMATQEIGLNDALAVAGITAYETDLAELIVQLSDDTPSHILVPAIHRNRAEIREIFRREMGKWGRAAPDALTDEPAALAEAARLHLRERFLRSKVAVSGANFLVAETGTLVVVESEGNGRMCVTLPDTLISVVGIEKIVPTWRDLEVFLQLLPRSATAERMNPYTSLWTGVTPGDGPRACHVVLMDNGRTHALADEIGRQALRCIRCSACLNVCPVYERTGGHAYGSVYPGPIGAILTPQLRGTTSDVDASLPYASTLCGACFDVCPVAIDIPEILVHLRERVVTEQGTVGERAIMRALYRVLASPRLFGLLERVLSRARGLVPRRPPLAGAWTDARDLPRVPAEPFRAWWRRTRGDSVRQRLRARGASAPAEGESLWSSGQPQRLTVESTTTPARPAPTLATTARAHVLRDVRRALTDVPDAETPDDVAVPRDYRPAHTTATAPLDPHVALDLLTERLIDYGAKVHRCEPNDVADWVRRLQRGTLAVPDGLPSEWLSGMSDVVADDPMLTPDQLDGIASVVTGCALAIADTGTIVLDGGPGQGRRALSLVPDHHICVVHADQVVASVPDAIAWLDPRRPMTWISGPSATSDIELQRVEGVHGPRTIDVVLVAAT